MGLRYLCVDYISVDLSTGSLYCRFSVAVVSGFVVHCVDLWEGGLSVSLLNRVESILDDIVVLTDFEAED